ncbi:MAG: Fur family transcriptional regulator [Chromatiales bacterium]
MSDSRQILQDVEVEARLRAHGVIPTTQRLAIGKFLFARHQHVTADQLHEALVRNGFKVAKATVYNTLGLFVKNGLMREIFVDANKTFYDSNTSHHHHYFNLDSGELSDMSGSPQLDIDEQDLPLGTAIENVDIVLRVRNKIV